MASKEKMNPETLWRLSDKELLTMIEGGYFPNRLGKIRFYAPSFLHYKTRYFYSSPATFPSISVTGSYCALKCKHCGGKVLNTMIPALTPEGLFNLCVEFRNEGAIGCLISGGCLPNGSVPLNRFMGVIAKVKRDLGLTMVVHTGVIDLPTAMRLKEAGADAALIDIIGSDETIREIYELSVKVEDYEMSLKALYESGIPTVPHVLVGLHYGTLKGELRALRIISKYSPSAVIIIALTPIHGTPMESVEPPTPQNIARVLTTARLMLPNTPIVLGCMRPKGKHRVKTDTLAVRAGVNGIAFPAEGAVQLAESLGLEVAFSSLCCSQIFDDLKFGLRST